ncbi:MAG: nuclear transport factor 2 family protein [Deltaproteobacteria bacterium]|nr:nuclear transport factor 2 family protein [Deltaproteobacteria bacterium]
MIDRRSFFVVAAAAVTLSGSAAGGPAVVGPLEEVKARLDAQRDAWNRGDLEAFCADYSDDCVFLSPSGVSRGRAEVLARYVKKYGGAKETMGTLSFEFVDDEASPEIVSLAMRWKLVFTGKPEASGLTLIVWHKIKGQWKLAQDASM